MNKIKVLFVCLGNICRSPAAQGVFSHLISAKNIANQYEIDSAGTSGYHQGELADRRMRIASKNRKIELTSKSRQFVVSDFNKFDFIIVMDDSNYDDVMDLDINAEFDQKVFKMTDFCDGEFKDFDHVPDPYYGGDEGFELVLNLLENGCQNFLKFLEEKKGG